MNKKFFIAWVVLFVAWMAGDFLVHGFLLRADYLQLTNLYRPQEGSQPYFVWMLLAHVSMAGAFTWIYSFGREAKPWLAQGVRYGIAVALLGVIPSYLIYYAVQPLPGTLVLKQIIFSGILVVVLGIIVAWLYREPATA